MTEKQTLWAHIEAEHKGFTGKPQHWTLADLQRWHSEQHHRYWTNHYHEFDNAGALAGPNTTDRRPSGWKTGLGSVPKR